MRFLTVNEQNFNPDLTPKQIRADVREIESHADLIFAQEIDPRDNDYEVFLDELGPKWAGTLGNTDCPFFYRKRVIEVIDIDRAIAPFEPVIKWTPKPRRFTGITFQLKTRPSFPPMAAVNGHMIAGGKNSANPRSADAIARARQWDIEFETLVKFIRNYRRQKLTTFVGMDWNHPRPPKPILNFKWLVGARLDRIGVTTVGGVEVEEKEDGVIDLISDHHAQWTRVHLSKAV